MDRSKSEPNDRSKSVGADFLQLDPAAAPAGAMAHWLAERLRAAIADGSLALGQRLPATRTLAAELGVSRGVVTEAYRRLSDDGLLAGRAGAGTAVVAAPVGRDGGAEPADTPRPDPFAGRADVVTLEELRHAPCDVDFTPGVPDLSAFPRAAWLRAERTVLDALVSGELGYPDPRGAPAARRAVARWLARTRGIRADPGRILIVSGTAQALDLLAMVLRDRGVDRVAVEDPGSLGTRRQLGRWLADTPPVGVDDEGARIEELEHGGAPAVLLTPAHQFPTGVVLSGARRRRLLDWAGRGGLVIEDDYDAEHRYDRAPVPALRSLLADRVCYAGSVSKLLAPALRVGWLLAPEELFEPLVEAKRFADLGNPLLGQLVLARLMDTGGMERHLRQLRRRQVRRRDAMLRALAAHLPEARVHGAAAGLHLTVTFDTAVDDRAIAAAALRRGVRTQPLSWHCQRPSPAGLVLGYAATPPGAIPAGVESVAAAAHEAGVRPRGILGG